MINAILLVLAIIIHFAIKGYAKYLDNKLKIDQDQFNSTKANNFANKKYTVSLGSALLFTLILIGGFLEKYGTRHTRLFVLVPLQSTAMSVVFPLLIILGNSKLMNEFLQFFARPFPKNVRCPPTNTIDIMV